MLNMADFTKTLLTNYYGFGEKKEFKSISSFEAFQKELDEHKSITNDLDKNWHKQDSLVVGSTSEKQIDDSGDNNGIINGLIRSWRAFSNDDEFNDEIVNLPAEEVDLEVNTSETDIQDNDKMTSGKLATIEKGNEKDELILNEDAAADNASEMSSVSTKKKITRKKSSHLNISDLPRQSFIPLPPIKTKKDPVITNEFCDMKNALMIEFPMNLFDKISNIRMLYLENNCLNELPDQIFSSLKYLQWLDVRNNWLKTLPKTIKNHSCLETILLQGNRIEKLPLELALVVNLKALQISANPIIYPPSGIVAQGFSSIMNFLKQEWNAKNPDEVVSSLSARVKLPSQLSSSKTLKKLLTRNISKSVKTASSREKGRSYKPSNRWRNNGGNSTLEEKLRWISKVRKMLIKQATQLQKMKDQEFLKEWRLNKGSFEKSMKKAAARSQEVNPFTVSEDFLNVKALQKSKLRRGNLRLSGDMDSKMFEIVESLQHCQNKDELITNLQLESLQSEIEKIERLYEEIQALKRQNDTIYKKFHGSNILNNFKLYKSPL